MLEALHDPRIPRTIVDFCCGSGNLTLPLAWRFPHWEFIGIDFKDKCIELLTAKAGAAGLTNVRGIEGTAAGAEPGLLFDTALALHACGSATDDAMRRAAAAGAAFIISPCCVGKVSGSISDGGPSGSGGGAAAPAASVNGLGLSHADFAFVASFADHASDGRPEARAAKRAVEIDRLRWARARAYDAALMELTPEHSYPKNDVIVGTMGGSLPRSSFFCA